MFKVDQIDHIHIHVSNQREAAVWYKKVLGFEILAEHEDRAVGGGPLTISSDGGNTSLALFERPEAAGKTVIAYRVGGQGFMEFLSLLEDLNLKGRNNKSITRNDTVDHDHSFSIYFYDPDQNPIEITTYDYDFVKNQLKI